MCGHYWIRHVAFSLHDAVLATCLLTGLQPPMLPQADLTLVFVEMRRLRSRKNVEVTP
jgi:hypothetical protein